MKKMFLCILISVCALQSGDLDTKMSDMDKRDIIIQKDLKEAYERIDRIKRKIAELEKVMNNLPCEKLKYALQSISMEIEDIDRVKEKHSLTTDDLHKIKSRLEVQKNKVCGGK